MTRSDYFRPVRGGISGLCEEADDKSIWDEIDPIRNGSVSDRLLEWSVVHTCNSEDEPRSI